MSDTSFDSMHAFLAFDEHNDNQEESERTLDLLLKSKRVRASESLLSAMKPKDSTINNPATSKLYSKDTNASPLVFLLGDSTLDNSLWTGGLSKKNKHAGTKHDTPAQILNTLKRTITMASPIKGPTKTEPTVINLAIDAITSDDLVQDGISMNTVFGNRHTQTHPVWIIKPISLFDKMVSTAKTQNESISSYAIVSVGGNDFRVGFLPFFQELLTYKQISYLQVLRGYTPQPLKADIRDEMEKTIASITINAKKIIKKIHDKSPETPILIGSQYFPDTGTFAGIPYFIYTAFKQIANAYGHKNAKQSLHIALKGIYSELFEYIKDEGWTNIAFIDMTEAVPSSNHHSHQIELSKKGSKVAGRFYGEVVASIEAQPLTEPTYFRMGKRKKDDLIRKPLSQANEDGLMLAPRDIVRKQNQILPRRPVVFWLGLIAGGIILGLAPAPTLLLYALTLVLMPIAGYSADTIIKYFSGKTLELKEDGAQKARQHVPSDSFKKGGVSSETVSEMQPENSPAENQDPTNVAGAVSPSADK